MDKPWQILQSHDPEVFGCIEHELVRQESGIELIASENMASLAVLCTLGNVMNNKYAEGLPGKRYYGGCEYVDSVETLANERAKALFHAKHSNVQPHSGAQANAAVCLALMKPGDRLLGMDLSHGGHLTHGSKVNFSGLLYEAHSYGLDPETEQINYDELRKIAKKVRPKVLIAGASAYPRIIDFREFRSIADEVGAKLWVDMAHIAGLVATNLHPDPVAHAHVVTTTTHKTLRGPRGGLILWNDDELNFNKAVFPGTQGGPLEHVIAAKAVAFKEAASPAFRIYQNQVITNTKALAQALKEKGFKLVSDGTDNHLVLLNLSGTEISGKALDEALGKAGITVNKNTVPNEKRSPFVTSGVRMGTPAITTRGMKETEMVQIAGWVREVFDNVDDESVLLRVKNEVEDLTRKFPLYPDWSR